MVRFRSIPASILIFPLVSKRTNPADVKAAVLAAFRAGAPGVVLSRKYAEMKLTNLAAAGEALRQLA
ncbi:MAG TPA: hypothetical protein VJT08_12795 [Terriglobales bacterium]|nr:hypothetical protein [Terriglobales bacterium]